MVLLPAFIERIQSAQNDLLVLTWEGGRNPEAPWDGGHYALPEHTQRPLSVSRAEAFFLANFAVLSGAENVLEIGTGFGYSTCWLAYGVRTNHPQGHVITVDDWSEGHLNGLGRETAKALWQQTGVSDAVSSITGRTPEVLEGSFPVFDLVFVDGEHRKGQPEKDYLAVRQMISSDGAIVFHDVQAKYDVPKAVQRAREEGFQAFELATSCQPVVVTKAGETLEMAKVAYSLAKRGLLVGDA